MAELLGALRSVPDVDVLAEVTAREVHPSNPPKSPVGGCNGRHWVLAVAAVRGGHSHTSALTCCSWCVPYNGMWEVIRRLGLVRSLRRVSD